MTSERIAGGLGYAVRTLLLGLAVLCTAVLAVDPALKRQEARGWTGFWGWIGDGTTVVVALAALALPLLLLWRRRHQDEVAWWFGILALVLPLGPVMAFVLPQTIRDQERRDAEALSFFYVLGLAVFFVRDSVGRSPATSYVRGVLSGEEDLASTEAVPLNLFAAVLLFLVVAVAPIALGFYRRARRELHDTRAEADTQRAATGQMEAQLSRQAERDLIAREVHDVIGHRLSLLSLHAGGLEVAVNDDPELSESARFVRESAQQAMDDLRSLVAVLRDPGSAAGTGAPAATSLVDLAGVVDEMADAGGPVTSNVFISDAEAAAPVLAHGVYRIVQELLTNARKHAPGQVVRLRVLGGPAEGVLVEASNPAPDPPGPGGSGLRGIGERATLLGGDMDVKHEDGRFTVRVHLPWQGRPTT